MKRLNKEGPPLLGSLPLPSPLSTDDLGDIAGRTDVAVIDTRADRSAFMATHLPGALHAPFDKSFATVAGSYVEPDMPVYLIIDEADLGEAVRALVRIGLDDVRGYATPAMLQQYADQGGTMDSIDEIDFSEIGLRRRDDVQVLDVRRRSEFVEGHLPDALNIAHTRLLARKDELPTDRRLVVHCQTGVRSAAAAALLDRYGYDVVYVNGTFENLPGPMTEEERTEA